MRIMTGRKSGRARDVKGVGGRSGLMLVSDKPDVLAALRARACARGTRPALLIAPRWPPDCPAGLATASCQRSDMGETGGLAVRGRAGPRFAASFSRLGMAAKLPFRRLFDAFSWCNTNTIPRIVDQSASSRRGRIPIFAFASPRLTTLAGDLMHPAPWIGRRQHG
ncbi:uncharacterized protein BDZ99DRAFT_534950 [Mytilinidion resinicola]|uniref:Uncharacterized protein n=1 Tax=Mytilinidion resinicola TaxID=574789 RepID=A0A6A6YII2_9PEZI|nr:uncharacterized protein BDZ99DRAFT_534950 [Mytilinidion resinicola]KAF2808662.1 hypothetical protein BDZ99DRAFT_534950 [Mytilinidion resinicola]